MGLNPSQIYVENNGCVAMKYFTQTVEMFQSGRPVQQRGAGRPEAGVQRARHQEDEHRVRDRKLQRTG